MRDWWVSKPRPAQPVSSFHPLPWQVKETRDRSEHLVFVVLDANGRCVVETDYQVLALAVVQSSGDIAAYPQGATSRFKIGAVDSHACEMVDCRDQRPHTHEGRCLHEKPGDGSCDNCRAAEAAPRGSRGTR